jgi:hypothetical protein
VISRIRIEAYGASAGDVETQLLEFAMACAEKVGAGEIANGEMVIERNLDEPAGSELAFKGRQVVDTARLKREEI